MDLLGGVGLKTWEQVGSDRKLEESQGGNNWYFDHSKADGDRKGKRQGEMEMKKMMEGRNEEQRERML